jgi:cysteinyl-tRNA synthetase
VLNCCYNGRKAEAGLLRIYNTLSKQVEEIQTVEPGRVRMYTCGPTVYRDAHIGNLRTYMMADWIRRVLQETGYEVLQVKNITDVGHMRQELVESGGDKMLLAALEEGKTVQDIAKFYTDAFHRDEARVNILPAHVFPSATQHIPEMLLIIERLVAGGYAYLAGGNIYFDVTKFSGYGKLSRNTGADLLEGVRAEADPLKQDARDFTLWKAAEPGRDLKWDSPWGEGFPGWHIECSAMAAKYLGEQFDIHTGGVDNIFPHHEDEIAQSEATFGRQHVKYWVHAQHLLADGAKMAKSSGNVFLVDELINRGFDPLSFRYLCLSVRYRHRMNFTFTSLRAAEKALTNLRHAVWVWNNLPPLAELPSETGEWRSKFWEAVESDLDLPGALALTWNLLRSGLPGRAKLALLLEFDRVFGLSLDTVPAAYPLPARIDSAIGKRTGLRTRAEYAGADGLRAEVTAKGYLVEDTRGAVRVRPKTRLEQQRERWHSVSSSREVESFLRRPTQHDFTFILNAYGHQGDVQRCLNSMIRYSQGYSTEIVVVDNGSTDGTADWLEEFQSGRPQVRVVHCDHNVGDAAGKNIGLKQSLGKNIIIMDGSAEIVGDLLGAVSQRLADESVGIFGPFGLTTDDMQHFHEEVDQGDADAMQAYCMAFRREMINTVGLMREAFRFYRNLDIDYCFQFKDKGYRIVADKNLPLVRHEHRLWSELDENQRDELSRKNFGRFLKRWGNRPDLLVTAGARGVGSHFFHH